MAVQIKIKGNKETNEFKDAIALKEIFEKEFRDSSIDGDILIICNATLFGQDTKDVDLIALGSFDKYSQRIKSKAKSTIKNGERSDKENLEAGYVKQTSPYGVHRWEKQLKQEERTVFIKDFCFVIETK